MIFNARRSPALHRLHGYRFCTILLRLLMRQTTIHHGRYHDKNNAYACFRRSSVNIDPFGCRQGQRRFFSNGGVAIPGNENFSAYWNSGYSFGLASDFIVSRIVQFQFRTEFTGFPLNKDAVGNLLNISPGGGTELSGGEIYALTVIGICASI